MWSDFCSGLYNYGFSGWQSVGLMLLHLVLFVGVIYLTVRLIIPTSKREDEAMRFLQEEFAKGLISKEEFIERREVLDK
jgi:putative membrane protein